MVFGIIGTSIWQQNLPLLERLTVDRDRKAEVLQQLKDKLQIDELIYLGTCNRVEFMYVTYESQPSDRLLHRLIDFFFCDGSGLSFFPNDFYNFTGKDAITHLFRTVSALDSLVVGETQITGQFKQAFQESEALGLGGAVIAGLAQEALGTARRVKRETSIGSGSVSMAALAVSALKKELAGRSEPVIALVGSGPMTGKLANALRKSVTTNLRFVNRTVDKAEKLAVEYGGTAIALEDFLAAPGPIDAIASATAASQAVFTESFLAHLSTTDAPVVCVDLAVPRDFTSVFEHDSRTRLIDIPKLRSLAQVNLRRKFVEAGQANDIVRESVTRYLSDRIEVSLKPIFHESYQESIALARKALDELFTTRLSCLDEESRESVQRLVTRLIGHSSFQPAKMLSSHLVGIQAESALIDLTAARKDAV
jgi:glutamyl-tRNA reductase